MTTPDDLRAQAEEHEAKARELREQASQLEHDALAALPVAERLVYSATARCPCGAGLAYDKLDGPRGSWDCSGILLGNADQSVQHTDRLPFVFWSIKSELQPSAHGSTTRPSPLESPTA